MAQQWNEIPAPSGKEAVSRTYGVAYRTDVIDVRVRGNRGQVEYMIKMTAGDALVYSCHGRYRASPIRKRSSPSFRATPSRSAVAAT
jgi:hypothetical protein